MVHMEETPDVVIVGNVVPDLPISIISDILSRVPVDDVARCKCVSKTWCTLAMEPHFSLLQWSRSSEMFSKQCHNILLWEDFSVACRFLFTNLIGDTDVYLISNREEGGQWKPIRISPQNHGFSGFLVASYYGLLCINTTGDRSRGPNLVYNPLTKDGVALPKLNFHRHYHGAHGYRCALGFDSVNCKFKVVVAYQRVCNPYEAFGPNICKMTGAILTLGESCWRILQFPEELESQIYKRESLFLNGAFNWVIGEWHRDKNESHLGGKLILDISTEEFSVINFSRPLVIPALLLEQIQLENALALVKMDYNTGPPSLEIWQIHGDNTHGSSSWKYRSFTVCFEASPSVNNPMVFRLLGALHNGVFLFKASEANPSSKEPLRDHLVLYDPEKDEGSAIEIPGTPKLFNADIFLPSLISPNM